MMLKVILKGYVKFKQNSPNQPVRISGKIENLKSGKHGIHVHVYGNLLKTECTKCGGHFNPYNKKHGGRGELNSHAGDLGNISPNKDGIARFYFKTYKLSLFNNKKNIIGRSIVIHRDEDDLGKGTNIDSLETGNSGPRLDGAVIGLDK